MCIFCEIKKYNKYRKAYLKKYGEYTMHLLYEYNNLELIEFDDLDDDNVFFLLIEINDIN